MKTLWSLSAVILAALCLVSSAQGQANRILYYVSTTGSDSNDGLSEATAFRTVTQAWNSIPQGEPLTQGYTITLGAGTYIAEDLPNYWESRYGTETAPIVFIAQNGPNTVYWPSVNLYDSRYITFDSLNIELTEGDPFHCEKCDHLDLVRNTIKGANPDTYNTQETIKINQSQYVRLIDNDISGAWDNPIDFVSVQYAQISGNKIHNGGDWCFYTKGGSAYITIDKNEIYDCGTGGYTAGQGTGFQFMTAPWIQHEAYAIWFKDNIVHDTAGAGVGVQGGYDVVITGNIFYKIGERSHIVEVGFGNRTCDGQPGDEGRDRCTQYRDSGGWGNDVVDDGTLSVRIPSRNVYIFNNVFANPSGYRSAYQHFSIPGPYEGISQQNSNLGTVHADDNLQIRGNVVWNGDASMLLGVEPNPDFPAGCQSDNPTCNPEQLKAENAINTVEPEFANAAAGDFTLTNAEALTASFSGLTLPDLPVWDVPVPAPDTAYFAYPISQ